MQINITPQEQRSIDHLITCMNKFTFGSPEWELARKSFRFIVRRIRQRELADEENVPHENSKTAVLMSTDFQTPKRSLPRILLESLTLLNHE